MLLLLVSLLASVEEYGEQIEGVHSHWHVAVVIGGVVEHQPGFYTESLRGSSGSLSVIENLPARPWETQEA